MELAIDRLLGDPQLIQKLNGKRVALLAHPASVTRNLVHTADALIASGKIDLRAAFGPQHGMRGDKQDNMIESEDYVDPVLKFPVFSLYGKVRRPTPHMLDTFDVVLVDLQDVGCRIYTFLTTLFYMLEECAPLGKSVWVLDRPNPAGRPIEGTILESGYESFVGHAAMPMRHGMTLGECAKWFVAHKKLDIDLQVIEMKGYDPEVGPGFGWPLGELSWVNPSPNATTLSMARAYSGTVLIEGTHLSEGRGTTRPLEVLGAPQLKMNEILADMRSFAPQWLKGCDLRICHFEPTFQKHVGKTCNGFQIHVDHQAYDPEQFKPYRLVTLWLKAIRKIHPEYDIWRSFTYEYESARLAIDLISGGTFLREWVDSASSTPEQFDARLMADEAAWAKARQGFLLY